TAWRSHPGDEQRRFRRHPSEIAGWAGEKSSERNSVLNDYAVSQPCGWLFYMGHLAIESAFRSPGDVKAILKNHLPLSIEKE
ncbi:hypothetical protein JGC78_24230, partial [Salmonella enterica subsp. enterica serovar Corvallis]|nr:hypothetical protein [Salmonella enterica subsp. enterica serovar Corvallis]MBJ3726592.1 hypothetical protein [Salmonella enterica subsp. enterica serovar Corvallis]